MLTQWGNWKFNIKAPITFLGPVPINLSLGSSTMSTSFSNPVYLYKGILLYTGRCKNDQTFGRIMRCQRMRP